LVAELGAAVVSVVEEIADNTIRMPSNPEPIWFE